MTYSQARKDIVFAISPKGFRNALTRLLAENDAAVMKEIFIDLQSRLVEWTLVGAVGREEIRAAAGTLGTRLETLLPAEELAAAKAEAESIRTANSSYLCRMHDEGKMGFIWGHDLCTGYEWSFRRGARFVTSNPAKINLFRLDFPERWAEIVAETERKHPGITAEEKVLWCWIYTVRDVAKEIRPIYEASHGKYGFVCIQPNPTKIHAGDTQAMIDEIRFFEAAFRDIFGTDDPNIVYKIPAVPAAREAIRTLKKDGLRLCITLNFSVFQHDTFGDIIGYGEYGDFLVLMGGIIDDYVKNELIAQGVDEKEAVEISHNAATYILNRSYANNRAKGIDPIIMGGSARGAWSIAAVLCEDAAHPVALTSMANMVALYDEAPRANRDVIRQPIDENILHTLLRSETFCAAYELRGLSDETLLDYPPLQKVSKSFIDAYNETLESLR